MSLKKWSVNKFVLRGFFFKWLPEVPIPGFTSSNVAIRQCGNVAMSPQGSQVLSGRWCERAWCDETLESCCQSKWTILTNDDPIQQKTVTVHLLFSEMHAEAHLSSCFVPWVGWSRCAAVIHTDRHKNTSVLSSGCKAYTNRQEWLWWWQLTWLLKV